MATTDDPTAHIRQFIATLTSANTALETIDRHLQDLAGDLGQLEQEAHDQGGGLNSELEQLRSRFDADEQDARNALEELSHAAADGQKTLDDAVKHVDEAGAHVEQQAHAAATDLDHEHGALVDQGFAAVGQAIDAAEQQLQAGGQETEQAFTELSDGVHGFETEAQAAWDAGGTAIEHADAEAAQHESELTSEASEAEHGFDAAGAELGQACQALQGEIATLYDNLAGGVDEAGRQLTESVQSLIQAAVGFVEAGTHSELEEPADALEHGGLDPLGEEYRQLQAVLEAATTVTAELDPLVDELVKCRTVVDNIDQVVNAMTEGA
jgi:DNA repair exonuclease SbcCD ATPase subunit